METWIIALIALGTAVFLILFIDCVLRCNRKRKRRNRIKNARQMQQPQIQQQQMVYNGATTRQFDNVYVIPSHASTAPVHTGVHQQQDPYFNQYAYGGDPERSEIYKKQQPYNPNFA